MGIISWVVGQGIGKIPLVGWAYSLTELIKSQVDDHTRKQLEVIRKAEGCSHILDCCSYSMMAGQGINAMTIASVGMTAWEAPNLLWVYHKQPDFKPIHARRVYRPSGNGRWGAERPGSGKKITGTFCRQCEASRQARG